MSHDIFAIGCAAGFGGDRTDAAAPVVETLACVLFGIFPL